MAALFFGSAEASRPVGGCRGKPGGLRSRRGGWPTGQGVPRMLGGFCSLPRRAGSAESGRGPAGLAPDGAGWATPEGRGEPPMKIGGLRGDILFESKEYPFALPKKDSRGDGVVTSFISLAAAKRAPAHSFRCSSFSHRKRCAGLRREPCFPPGTPLKRPKGGCGPPLETPIRRWTGVFFCVGTGDGGEVPAVIPGVLCLRETRFGVAW